MRLIEPFGGLAAYSLKVMALEHERVTRRRCRHEPPVSRMGNKAGFVPNVLKAWGLNRVRWSSVWMNDLDPVCHLFHLIYASSELRDAVARRTWAWVPCPVCLPHDVQGALEGRLKPTREQCAGRGRDGCEECNGTGVQDCRRLWERIRKEPVPVDLVEAASAGLLLQGRTINTKPLGIGDDGAFKSAGFLADVSANGVEVWNAHGVDEYATRVGLLPSGFATLAHVAASAVFLQSRSFSLRPVSIRGGWEEHGDKPEIDDRKQGINAGRIWDDSPRWTVAERLERLPGWVEHGYGQEGAEWHGINKSPASRWSTAKRLDSLPGPGGMSLRITRQDAALCLPTGDASECLVVADPPYVGTSGYANDATRATVLSLAQAWHDAGALVLIHEAVGLAGELGKGWLERPATVLRGRKSTFWGEGGEREWLTFNREPVWWPETQGSLF